MTVLLVDRCLGVSDVPSALRAASLERGLSLEVVCLDDHFDQKCADETWLVEAGHRGWIVLTKDKHITRRPAERRALFDAKVAAFVLTSGARTGAENAAALVAALPRILRLAEKYTRPLLATVTNAGHVKVIEGRRRAAVRKAYDV